MKFTPGCDKKAFIASMTLDQKIALQATASAITSAELPELGLPAMGIADGATGINFLQVYLDRLQRIMNGNIKSHVMNPDENDDEDMEDEILRDVDRVYRTAKPGTIRHQVAAEIMKLKPGGLEPTCFPSGVVIGSTWDPARAEACGRAVGREMSAYGADVILGPNVDIQRDPRGGRSYECYGEDPYLVGKMAAAVIRGMQSAGTAACAKHFCANNQETNRNRINEIISERALRELYFRGFEAAIREGGVKSIMMAYNRVNGEHCAESRHLMTDVIRGDWGYEGCIVSDWGAARDEARSMTAGLDFVLPARHSDLKKEIAEGRLSEEVLDRCVERILTLFEDLRGMTGRESLADYDDADAVRTVYETICDGAILLKNEGVLPLRPGTPTAFYGRRSRQMIDCGGGSTQVFTKKTSSLYDTAAAICGPENVWFEELPGEAKALVYTVAYPGHEESDSPSLLVERRDQLRLADTLRRAKEQGVATIVILNTAGPVDMREWIDLADAVLCLYLPGCEGGHAAGDILYGLAEPGGRLTQTFPVRYEDCPASLNFPGMNGEVLYGEDIFVGYRWYDKRDIAPRFPFGHGLSYTRFAMEPESAPRRLNRDEPISAEVRVKVTNCGDRVGSEVVQVYLGTRRSAVLKPVRELVGFAKVHLAPGESETVTIPLDSRSFSHYDEAKGGWCVEPGQYTLYIGRSSRDFCAELPIEVTGRNPYGIHELTPVEEALASEPCLRHLTTILPDLAARRGELLELYRGRTLIEMYDDIMEKYYINPIHGAMVLKKALRELNAELTGKGE